jgi:hypothetical protein
MLDDGQRSYMNIGLRRARGYSPLSCFTRHKIQGPHVPRYTELVGHVLSAWTISAGHEWPLPLAQQSIKPQECGVRTQLRPVIPPVGTGTTMISSRAHSERPTGCGHQAVGPHGGSLPRRLPPC